MDSRYRRFGENVQAAREKAELSQLQLGELVGLSRASISNIEGGRQRVQLHAAFNIAAALRVDLATLWEPHVSPLPLADNLSEPGLVERESVRTFIEKQRGSRTEEDRGTSR